MKPVTLKRGEKVTCKCGNQVGSIVEVEDVDLLETGGGLAKEFHGVCKCCGQEFHWSTNGRRLERLLQRVGANRPAFGTVIKA